MNPASLATVAAGLLRFTEFVFRLVMTPILTWHIPGLLQPKPYQFTLTPARPLAAAVIAAMAAMNYFGVRTARRIQIVLVTIKVAAVISIIVLGLALGRLLDRNLYTWNGRHILTALVPVMDAYNGP